jgi:hypothetical protein
MAGLVGIAALARILAARRAQVAAPVPTTIAPPEAGPAEALRRKLSETREEPGAAAETPSTTGAPEPTETLEERRARVHAKAQEAMDAMDALQEPPT